MCAAVCPGASAGSMKQPLWKGLRATRCIDDAKNYIASLMMSPSSFSISASDFFSAGLWVAAGLR